MSEELQERDEKQGRRKRRLAVLALEGFGLALLCGLAAMLSGLGYRWGWWALPTSFSILRWAAYGGLAAAALSLVGALIARPGGPRRGFAFALIGLAAGLATAAVPWSYLRTARSVPPIHDITTDTSAPPEFVAVLPLRKDAPNPAEYGGPSVAAQQVKAYPDLAPPTFKLSPDQIFEIALEAAKEMGWEIVAAVPAEGRIEATDTTFWFGFKDDVVIRIAPTEEGTRVDVRSVSRVGRSDVGKNAERIRSFLDELSAAARNQAG